MVLPKSLSVHFMSESIDWATPLSLFQELDDEFHFDVDVCASDLNDNYWSIDDNCLSKDWSGKRCFMNPPYGREISDFVRKAANSGAELVVGLLPARTDTSYFHDWIYHRAEIRFIRGRVKFVHPDKVKSESAPFPSMIVIWRDCPLQELLF